MTPMAAFRQMSTYFNVIPVEATQYVLNTPVGPATHYRLIWTQLDTQFTGSITRQSFEECFTILTKASNND